MSRPPWIGRLPGLPVIGSPPGSGNPAERKRSRLSSVTLPRSLLGFPSVAEALTTGEKTVWLGGPGGVPNGQLMVIAGEFYGGVYVTRSAV